MSEPARLACEQCVGDIAALRATTNDMVTLFMHEAQRQSGGSEAASTVPDFTQAASSCIRNAQRRLQALRSSAATVQRAVEEVSSTNCRRLGALAASKQRREGTRKRMMLALEQLRDGAKRPKSSARAGSTSNSKAGSDVAHRDVNTYETALRAALQELRSLNFSGEVSYQLVCAQGNTDKRQPVGMSATFGTLFRVSIAFGVAQSCATAGHADASVSADDANGPLAPRDGLGTARVDVVASHERPLPHTSPVAHSGAQESSDMNALVWPSSEFVVFRQVSLHAQRAFWHFRNTSDSPASALAQLFRWLGNYHNIFTARCTATGTRLQFNKQVGAMLPPTFRAHPSGKAYHPLHYIRLHGTLFPSDVPG